MGQICIPGYVKASQWTKLTDTGNTSTQTYLRVWSACRPYHFVDPELVKVQQEGIPSLVIET